MDGDNEVDLVLSRSSSAESVVTWMKNDGGNFTETSQNIFFFAFLLFWFYFYWRNKDIFTDVCGLQATGSITKIGTTTYFSVISQNNYMCMPGLFVVCFYVHFIFSLGFVTQKNNVLSTQTQYHVTTGDYYLAPRIVDILENKTKMKKRKTINVIWQESNVNNDGLYEMFTGAVSSGLYAMADFTGIKRRHKEKIN
jgi:hypothetical protein